MAVLFKYHKKCYLNWKSVRRSQARNYACESVCVWMVNTVRVLTVHVLLRVVSTKLHGFWYFVRWRHWYLWSTMGKVGFFFICLWRVRSEEQISVSYHLSLTFLQQYSVTSICSRFNGGKTRFFFFMALFPINISAIWMKDFKLLFMCHLLLFLII